MTPCSCPCGGLQCEPRCVLPWARCVGSGAAGRTSPGSLPCLQTLGHSTARPAVWLIVLPAHPDPLNHTESPRATLLGDTGDSHCPSPQPCARCPCPGTTATDSTAALGEALGTALCQMQLKTITVPQSSEQASSKWAPPDVTVAGPPRFGVLLPDPAALLPAPYWAGSKSRVFLSNRDSTQTLAQLALPGLSLCSTAQLLLKPSCWSHCRRL